MPVDYQLLYDIYSGNDMIVIIGSELLRMDEEDASFEQKVIAEITKSPYNRTTGPRTFSELAIRYPRLNSGQLKGIYSRIDSAEGFNTNLLEHLKRMKKVDMFISTSFERKIEDVIGDSMEVKVFQKKPIYLNLREKKQQLLYLFGRIGENSGDLALFEEDQIDMLMSLVSCNEINKNITRDNYSLLEYLSNKTLVFLGNNFPDWFMRLLLRTLFNQRLNDRLNKAYIINDKNACINYEKYFFDKFGIELIHDYPIETFLHEFCDFIETREPFDDWYNPLKVFISYRREDMESARQIQAALKSRHIEVFLDVEEMGIARHEEKITNYIQSPDTCICICLLSKSLAETAEKDTYVKRVEWKRIQEKYFFVLEAQKRKIINEAFHVVPIAVDDYSSYSSSLPGFIRENNILALNEETFELIEQKIKEIAHARSKSI